MKIGNHETFTKPNRPKEMFSSFLYLSNCFKWTDSITSCLFSSRPQIREQMCLETHFQYEFPIFGRFGQSGRQRKKVQSMQLFRPIF